MIQVKFKIKTIIFRKTVLRDIISLSCKDDKENSFEINLPVEKYPDLDLNEFYTIEIKNAKV